MSPCSINGSDIYKATYTCDLVRGQVKTRVVWNAAGPSEYRVPVDYTRYEDLLGNSHAIGGTSVGIGIMPILLKP